MDVLEICGGLCVVVGTCVWRWVVLVCMAMGGLDLTCSFYPSSYQTNWDMPDEEEIEDYGPMGEVAAKKARPQRQTQDSSGERIMNETNAPLLSKRRQPS